LPGAAHRCGFAAVGALRLEILNGTWKFLEARPVKRTSAGPLDETFQRSKSSRFQHPRLTGYDAKSGYDAMS
jgi:hypothetical protein